MGSRWMRNSFVYLLILVAVIAIVVAFFRPSSDTGGKKDLTTVITDAKAGSVEKIEVEGNKLNVHQERHQLRIPQGRRRQHRLDPERQRRHGRLRHPDRSQVTQRLWRLDSDC